MEAEEFVWRRSLFGEEEEEFIGGGGGGVYFRAAAFGLEACMCNRKNAPRPQRSARLSVGITPADTSRCVAHVWRALEEEATWSHAQQRRQHSDVLECLCVATVCLAVQRTRRA